MPIYCLTISTEMFPDLAEAIQVYVQAANIEEVLDRLAKQPGYARPDQSFEDPLLWYLGHPENGIFVRIQEIHPVPIGNFKL